MNLTLSEIIVFAFRTKWNEDNEKRCCPKDL